MLPGYGWRPPDANNIKITTDASINFGDGIAGAGGVARSASVFLRAWCKPYMGVSDPLIAEVQAMKEGMIFSSLRGFTEVTLETECLEAGTIATMIVL